MPESFETASTHWRCVLALQWLKNNGAVLSFVGCVAASSTGGGSRGLLPADELGGSSLRCSACLPPNWTQQGTARVTEGPIFLSPSV